MTTQMIIAQCLMVLTLIIMITGKTPLYLTAIVGAAVSAIVAGYPIAGSAPMTVGKMINMGLNPVIADMTGILLFIGIMQATGFLDVIVRDIVLVGNKIGGGPGVCTAGGIAAGLIGALTGFTQPVITAVITGPAAVRLGVDPNKAPVFRHTPAISATSQASPIRPRSPFSRLPASVMASSMCLVSLPLSPFLPCPTSVWFMT